MKLLIIEDDEDILSFLKRGFHEDGYIVDSALNGEDGEYLASSNTYDIIIIDWMLPYKSGIEIIKSLREKNITIPIIMLSAKGEIEDKVAGLQYGADDYLAKPFLYQELVARVEALHRRDISNGVNLITVGDIIINIDTKTVRKDNINIELTAKEYELLLFLIKHQNSYVSNTMIENQLWDNQEYINSNVIQVTIYNLRKKLSKELIKSTRGLGYKIAV